MITSQKEIIYRDLFKKAFDILMERAPVEFAKNPNYQTCVRQETIINMDTYFMSLGTLINCCNSTAEMSPFVLIPLDEPPFAINANTREIIVPNEFKRGIAVQGDYASEILVFTIDRYFDHTDLNSTNIYIQYTTPKGEERAYKVDLVDYNSVPGKLRFGWLLGDTVTAHPGSLKFSVRFFKTGEDKNITYSFNTLTQTVNIYPALQPVVNENEDGLGAKDLFKNSIRNSLKAGQIPPQFPTFNGKGAINLKPTINLVEDTATLEAQAIAENGGLITYQWYYAEDGVENKGFTLIDPESQVWSCGHRFQETEDTSPVPGKQYYQEIENSRYEVYNGNFSEEDFPIYEMIQTCKIVPGKEDTITGSYIVKAKNSFLNAENQPEMESNWASSAECVIPSPGDIAILENLNYNEGIILDEENTPSFKVKVKADAGSTVTVTWKYQDPEGNDHTAFSETQDYGINEIEKEFTCTPAAKGFYYVVVNSVLNRTSREAPNNPDIATKESISRATNMPVAPTQVFITDEDSYKVNKKDGVYTVEAQFEELTIDPFICDEQVYEWYYRGVDDDKEDPTLIIKTANFIEGEVDKSSIVFKGTTPPLLVWCKSTNKLNGKKASAESDKKAIVGINV